MRPNAPRCNVHCPVLASALLTRDTLGATTVLFVHRYATFVIFYGACMNATLFGQVALLLQNQNSVYHRFQQELDSVNQNMRILNLPEELQQRVRNYYDYWFHRHRLLDYRKFVSQLSSALGSEVCLYLHREMVQKVPLFRHCSADFLVALVKTLSHRVYMPGDFIVRYGEVRTGTRYVGQTSADLAASCLRALQFGFEMYFINSGECDIIAKNGCGRASMAAALNENAVTSRVDSCGACAECLSLLFCAPATTLASLRCCPGSGARLLCAPRAIATFRF